MVVETSKPTRAAGVPALACIAAGVLGLLAAAFLAFVPPAVGEDRFSYPLAPGGFAAIQIFFAIHHVPLVWAAFAVWRSGAAGTGRLAGTGGILSTAGLALLTIHELVAIVAANAPYPGGIAETVESIYGVISILTGIGFVILGIAVLRARQWSGWTRWVPLAIGVYVFAPLTPAIFGPHVVARLAIGVWMVMFAGLGVGLLRAPRRQT